MISSSEISSSGLIGLTGGWTIGFLLGSKSFLCGTGGGGGTVRKVAPGLAACICIVACGDCIGCWGVGIKRALLWGSCWTGGSGPVGTGVTFGCGRTRFIAFKPLVRSADHIWHMVTRFLPEVCKLWTVIGFVAMFSKLWPNFSKLDKAIWYFSKAVTECLVTFSYASRGPIGMPGRLPLLMISKAPCVGCIKRKWSVKKYLAYNSLKRKLWIP